MGVESALIWFGFVLDMPIHYFFCIKPLFFILIFLKNPKNARTKQYTNHNKPYQYPYQ